MKHSPRPRIVDSAKVTREPQCCALFSNYDVISVLYYNFGVRNRDLAAAHVLYHGQVWQFALRFLCVFGLSFCFNFVCLLFLFVY
jgi:hypothetical protein